MSNYNETESTFGEKLKKVLSNRAVVVAIVTMVVAVAIVIAVTVSANRSKQPTPVDPVVSGQVTEAVTNSTPSGIGEETLPTYHGQETQPVVNDKVEDPAFDLPVQGKLFKDHDATVQVYSATMGDYRVHLGVDIATEENAPVFAVADGKVERIWEDTLMGTCVAISHEGDVLSVYKNLAAELSNGLTEGATVTRGKQLGNVGDTAILEMADEPHLHFEMTAAGLAVDPLDYFDKATVEALSKDTAFEQSAVTAAGK